MGILMIRYPIETLSPLHLSLNIEKPFGTTSCFDYNIVRMGHFFDLIRRYDKTNAKCTNNNIISFKNTFPISADFGSVIKKTRDKPTK